MRFALPCFGTVSAVAVALLSTCGPAASDPVVSPASQRVTLPRVEVVRAVPVRSVSTGPARLRTFPVRAVSLKPKRLRGAALMVEGARQ